jgi:fructose-bisphosphate aldolase class II
VGIPDRYVFVHPITRFLIALPLTGFFVGIRDYVTSKIDYLKTQVGNPDGEDKPNKKYYDPRVWVREGEKTMSKRIKVALDDFYTAGQL